MSKKIPTMWLQYCNTCFGFCYNQSVHTNPIFQALNWIIGSTDGRFLCHFHSHYFLHIIRFPHAGHSYLIWELLDSNIMNMHGFNRVCQTPPPLSPFMWKSQNKREATMFIEWNVANKIQYDVQFFICYTYGRGKKFFKSEKKTHKWKTMGIYRSKTINQIIHQFHTYIYYHEWKSVGKFSLRYKTGWNSCQFQFVK